MCCGGRIDIQQAETCFFSFCNRLSRIEKCALMLQSSMETKCEFNDWETNRFGFRLLQLAEPHFEKNHATELRKIDWRTFECEIDFVFEYSEAMWNEESLQSKRIAVHVERTTAKPCSSERGIIFSLVSVFL